MGRRSLFLSLVLLIAACAGGGLGPGIADRGIGGTGIAVGDRGIGGTGIVGTVTAFGSVWVNGLRVDLPPTVTVRIEGRAADSAAVRIGHLVAMTAAPGGPTGLEARTLDVRYAVAGPVERVEKAVALVLGQRVELADLREWPALVPGAWVAVSGLRRSDGAIVASRIDGWTPSSGWLLRGRLEAVTPASVTVAGVTLPRDGGDMAILPVGSAVRVSGGDGTGASSLALDPFNPFGSSIGALSVETFTDASGRAAGPGTPLGGLAAGSRVVIDSIVESGGGLGGSRAYGAPSLGGTAAFGADPATRAAGLAARAGARRDGPAEAGPSGMGPPDGDASRADDTRGWGRSPNGATDGPDRGIGNGPNRGVRGPPGGAPGGPPGGQAGGGPRGGGFGGFGGPKGGGDATR